MLHLNNKLVFSKLIGEISGGFIQQTCSKYGGDYRTQHFDTQSHLYALLYSNFRNCKSLRELQIEISSNKKLNDLINVPSLSQFSRKNASRDYRIFEDIFYHLVNKAKRKFGEVKLSKECLPLKIVDSSVVLVALKLAPSLQIDSERAGIKVSTLFNGEFPEKVAIVNGKVNDRKCIDGMFEQKGCIYLFDRGYYDYRWYDKLSEKGIKFVTRGIKNSIVMEEKLRDSDLKKDIYDAEVTMGSIPGGNLTFKNYLNVSFLNQI